MSALSDVLQRELRARPITLIVLSALIAGYPYLWYTTAKASDVDAIKAQVMRLSQSVERRQIEARIAALEAELFSIAQKIKDAESKNLPIDALYYGRRSQLQTDLNQAQRDLALLGKDAGD